MPGKSVLGLSEKQASMLAYAGLFVSGILILIFERDNKTVRFHAMQSTVFFIMLLTVSTVITWLFGWIWIIGGMVNSIVSGVNALAWLYLIFKAYSADLYRLPIIGDIAYRQVTK